MAGALGAPDRDDSSVRLVRGIRALIIAPASVAIALGIAYASRATMLIAAVVLAEELYETRVVLLDRERRRPRSQRQRRGSSSSAGARHVGGVPCG